jgi:5'-nucleotidase
VRPLVLLSNDDGVHAPGLVALRAELARAADVVVCAPESNQSATSHSLTLHRALRLREHSAGGLVDTFSLDGTPADCVYVALHSGTRVLPRRPDLVVSGMNHGLNLGADVFYSGTVAAAREGALRGLPAVAISADRGADRERAAALGARLALAALEHARERPGPFLLNVNIPPCPSEPGTDWEVRATKLGSRLYEDEVVYRRDPRGDEYLWIGGALLEHEAVPGSDTEAHDARIASVTPLVLDLADRTGHALAHAVTLLERASRARL